MASPISLSDIDIEPSGEENNQQQPPPPPPPLDNADEGEDNDDDFEGKLLHQSCLWDNLDLLTDLLFGDERRNVNSQDSKGRTALHAAVISNSVDCARLLLMNGADPNIRQFYDKNNWQMSLKSCLHLAAERGQSELVQVLIEFGANIFTKDANGFTAMDLAEQGQFGEIVDRLKKALIDYEAKRDDLYKSLAIAVHRGDTESVRELLVLASKYSIVEDSKDEECTKSIVNYAPNGSNTLLFKACQEGHLEIVKLLINAGADGRQHAITKYSPLYISAYHGRFAICQVLLEHFPYLSSVFTVEHWLPIHAAAINNHQEIVQLLLTYNYTRNVMKRFYTNFDIESNSTGGSGGGGKKPTSTSKPAGSTDCDKQFLYLMPFDFNAQDIAGQSILYLATLVGNQSLIEFLLNYRLKAILFADFVEHFQVKTNDNIETEYDLIHCGDEDRYTGYQSEESSEEDSSSEDVTVIGTVGKSSQPQPCIPSNRNLSSSIQKLINKLSPTTSPINKPPTVVDAETEANFLKRNKRIYLLKSNVQIYLINPFKIDLYCNYDMETALQCAVKKRHYSIARLLLENGADPNLPINGKVGNTSIVTRVSHFNHNLFSPTLTKGSLKEFKSSLGGSEDKPTLTPPSTSGSASSLFDLSKTDSKDDFESRVKSTCLREAIRNRDKNMVDLLLRFGARDDLNEETNELNHESASALNIAFQNGDFHFVSKLLSLKAFGDPEYKINKKSFDIVGSNCMNAFNKFNKANTITVSSMFPTNSVMIDWHHLDIKCLDTNLQQHLSQWLIDASLIFNVKLKLSQITDSTGGWNTALAAITRIDLSNNGLTSIPLMIFTDLPSVKILNLSKNCLQTLPELKFESNDDESVSSYRRNNSLLEAASKNSKNLFSKMRKSHSVTSSLSSSMNRPKSARTEHEFHRTHSQGDPCTWNLPFLEELYLQDNQLECLPSSLFQQPELKILDLSNNKLRTLPPLFWFSPKLSELNLSLNLLCDLPSPVQCLKQISTSFDLIEESPGTPRSMSKSISTSSISELSKSITDLMDFAFDEKITHSNLSPFELNLTKPWSGCVNILNDSFHADLESKEKQMDTVSSTQDPPSTSTVKSSQTCSLTQLNLSHNGFEKVPFFLSCLANKLTHLNLSYNRLTTIFDSEVILGQYPLSLKHLDLSHNQIVDWFPGNELDRCSIVSESSDESNLDECRVNCFHQFVSQQMHHQSQLADLKLCCPGKQHNRLDSLKTLILANNQLKAIIVTKDELLEAVNHQTNTAKMFDILRNNSSFFLSNFQDEKRTQLSSRLSMKLFNRYGSCDDLTALDSNDGMNLNPKASRYAKLFFPNLSMLDVANNQIVLVPKSIAYFCQLSVLNLSGNLVLTSLPPEMGLLSKLWNLNTRGCVNLNEPLRSMINSKTYKTCDIISYLNSILENSKPYMRMKLMIVGLQGIGKTSLLEMLRHEGTGRRHRPPDHWGKRMGSKSMGMRTPRGVTLSTVGVDLSEWTYERRPLRSERSLSRTRVSAFQAAPSKTKNLDISNFGPITFRTWDFGGQQEYYATHQYFLSKRSIYLVVWKITDGEKGVLGLHSWLVNIQSRAPNSPVIIVGTHYDLVKEFYPPFFSSELQNMIRDRYMSDVVDADKRGLPKVVASIEVSAKTRYNIRLLANLIYETALEIRTSGSKERLLEQKVPATYLALEEIVSYLASERIAAKMEPVLHFDQYRQEVIRLLKERHGLAFRDYSELQQATRFLHDNGVILHYEDANLKDLYFLDPQWLCDMLAHVVTIREINPFAKNGIMKTENLLQLFKNTKSSPTDVQSYLLSLLNKFELALTWDNRTLLIPSLLPTEDQLRFGHVGCDISIPMRSRMKLHQSLSSSKEESDSTVKFEFKNQLKFSEIQEPPLTDSGRISADRPKPNKFYQVTALARHSDSVSRLLLLSYVPCGFWSRLIVRILADETVIEIVRAFYDIPTSVQVDSPLASYLNSAKTKWHCWQTGFGLRYFDTFLLRVKEICSNELLPLTNTTLEVRQSQVSKSSYPYDYQRIKFYLTQQRESSVMSQADGPQEPQWSEVHSAPQGSSLIELYLPNQALQVDIFDDEELDEGFTSELHSFKHKLDSFILEPNQEMLTKLLVIIVEHIDTLLEDWYPSLGTRFIHTSDGRFLITRIIPCTLCTHRFISETIEKQTSNSGSEVKAESILSPDTTEVDSNLVDFYKAEVKKASAMTTDSAISTMDTAGEDSTVKKQTDTLSLYHSVYAFMVEECILAVSEDRHLKCPTHGRIRMDKIAPDIVFRDLKESFCIEHSQLRFGKLLGRGSFGFVFRAYYTEKKRAGTKSGVPEVSKQSNSLFYVSSEQRSEMYFEVALKLLQPIHVELCSGGIRKVDVEAYTAMKSKWDRDPMQYACKAYCTARTELNILASLKHPNIASIIGICPKPLALVLTLAPHGSLDTHIKAFRRSGTRIATLVLQKAFLQISKALEYLHQHHIIYRDLKSENVLVWCFPNPLQCKQCSTKQFVNQNIDVDLKLADYGISRSSLPTGTKGFGGTEGFMAPEIMIFNGEEEYTEKVDCFSFAMFMYELCTLRFPFEGQEFAIRESILDGIRPSLSQRDLEYLPECMVDLMTRCWAHEPTDRPTISQVVSIISAPEFCALRDVAILADNCAIICAIGFLQSKSEDENRFGLCLSRIGKQVDYLPGVNSKWNPMAYKLNCDNLANRTITSACMVDGKQLWLGDSRACIYVHDLASSDIFKLLCAIQIESENPQSLTAIKSIHWISKANLIAICSNSGHLWILNNYKLRKKLDEDIEPRCTIVSSELGIQEIANDGSMILCLAHVNLWTDGQQYVDLWCGQLEGKILIVRIRVSNLAIVHRVVVNHYDDLFGSNSLNISYIGSSVPLAERNDVFLLVGGSSEACIWSVLNTGFVIYQWDASKRVIVHRLDCSKLAPCSESLMSISIEDHLKPGNCQITEIAINEQNDELYIGTNSGCIIVAESLSLKPITVFRPFHNEVKFIVTLPVSSKPDFADDALEEEDDETIKKRVTALSAIKNVSTNLWPFNRKDGKKLSMKDGKCFRNTIPVTKKQSLKQITPFVTIGKGYRNLLDRFTESRGSGNKNRKDSIVVRKGIKLKDSNSLHALIWDSGYWDFGS